MKCEIGGETLIGDEEFLGVTFVFLNFTFLPRVQSTLIQIV
jgi:hypothetical protein